MILGDILFLKYKTNEIVNKFLFAADKFMSELHLKQPGFTYIACGPFTKSKERIQKSKETEDPRYIFQNELQKNSFHYDIACGDFKDLPTRAAFDNVLLNETFNVA